MFKIGSMVVHPLHGAGIIELIEEKKVLNQARKYYVIKISGSNMRVMVPINSVEKVGLRIIIDEEEVDKVLEVLKGDNDENITDWKMRYSINLDKIKSGSIYKVAEVARTLSIRSKERGLSSGEKRLFDNACQLIVSELAFAKNMKVEEVSFMVNGILERKKQEGDDKIEFKH
ncbi:MAG: CarD family transcriptional regulator [bacterium]|nr:CarD family transcriptional regulator [bacterium]